MHGTVCVYVFRGAHNKFDESEIHVCAALPIVIREVQLEAAAFHSLISMRIT